MQITFCGAAQVVTGSCYLVESDGYRLLVDCGMFQGSKTLKDLNYGPMPFQPASIDAVLLTHAHIDHSGLLPKLIKQGFKGKVWATHETVKLCEIMLPDSGHIQEMEVERKNRKFIREKDTPLLEAIYTAEDALRAMSSFQAVNYRQAIRLTDHISFEFCDAGHILGSASIILAVREKGIVKQYIFAGDVGSLDQPFVEDPCRLTEGDVVLVESTYGGVLHQHKNDRVAKLAEIINQAYQAGGHLVIPAFAVERTQDLLYYIRHLQAKGQIPVLPIYIDSPMAIAATKIFAENTEHFDEEARELIQRGENPFELPNLHYSQSAEDSKALNELTEQSIIISASGMADAGRIKYHLKNNLWKSEATILFVGYQAEGTVGRALLEGAEEVRIHGQHIAVRAHVAQIDGFSAHADQEELLYWLDSLAPAVKQIILVHGELQKQKAFAERIAERYGKTAFIPEIDERFVFTEDQVLRYVPEHSRLTQMPAVPAQTSGNASPAKKATKSQVRRAYEKLSRRLENMVGSGYNADDFGKTLATMEQISAWLDEHS
ncbi:MAG: MBL fold metallo-hydrolase [Peptococcaceae bacterium]|jgi:metallo-beta-lactamase family protein|nr:MBL fold metallo-hydrolase [Peptococcaceae bacterium]